MRKANLNTIEKMVSKVSHYSSEQFISDAKQWIKAIESGSMNCTIESVSKSGMSRIFCYRSYQRPKGSKRGYYRNYFSFMKALGYNEVRNGFRVSGCGMDMNFNTCYNIAHRLHDLGLLQKSKLDSVSQNTPTIF